MLEHRFRMKIGDEERDIVTLRTIKSASVQTYHHATQDTDSPGRVFSSE
jgi:hypothetical protein